MGCEVETTFKEDPELAAISRELAPAVNEARKALVHGERKLSEGGLEAAWETLQDQGRTYREGVLEQVAAGAVSAAEGIERLDAVRSARRVGYPIAHGRQLLVLIQGG